MDKIPEADNDPGLSQAFKQWVGANVEFTRGDMPQTSSPATAAPWMGVTPGSLNVGSLNVEGSFFDSRNNATAQTNVVTFELGKALWYHVNGSDTKVAQTQAGHEFQNLRDQHPAINEMKFAPPVTNDPGDLPNLADFSDLQSPFGYAVRVAVGNLGPPPKASAEVKRDWPGAVQAMQQFLKKNLSRKK
jgi:hypothetical protein